MKNTVNEGLFGAAKKFSDAFFDGLKVNAVNSALVKAKQNQDVPIPIIKKMDESRLELATPTGSDIQQDYSDFNNDNTYKLISLK